MLHFEEILGAIADQDRAIEFRVATDVVVVTGTERSSVRAVEPKFVGSEVTPLEDRPSVATLRRIEQLAPFFQV